MLSLHSFKCSDGRANGYTHIRILQYTVEEHNCVKVAGKLFAYINTRPICKYTIIPRLSKQCNRIMYDHTMQCICT